LWNKGKKKKLNNKNMNKKAPIMMRATIKSTSKNNQVTNQEIKSLFLFLNNANTLKINKVGMCKSLQMG
jgi:3-oxoacyl-[acyl-carrier-protein] synthase III